MIYITKTKTMKIIDISKYKVYIDNEKECKEVYIKNFMMPVNITIDIYKKVYTLMDPVFDNIYFRKIKDKLIHPSKIIVIKEKIVPKTVIIQNNRLFGTFIKNIINNQPQTEQKICHYQDCKERQTYNKYCIPHNKLC